MQMLKSVLGKFNSYLSFDFFFHSSPSHCGSVASGRTFDVKSFAKITVHILRISDLLCRRLIETLRSSLIQNNCEKRRYYTNVLATPYHVLRFFSTVWDQICTMRSSSGLNIKVQNYGVHFKSVLEFGHDNVNLCHDNLFSY